MALRLGIGCSILVILLAGCSIFRPTPEAMMARPDDFSLQYEWREGSLPPPYHYEYTISIAPDGRGQVVMVPDYPSDKVPTWTETFTLQPAQLDTLYQSLVEQGLFRQSWRAQDNPPVGGSSQSLVITAQGKTVVLPAYVLIEQEAAAEEIYAAVMALVPKPIWDKLNAQREQYVQEHEE